MYAGFRVSGQAVDGSAVPLRGSVRLRLRHEFSPQRTKLKAHPRHGERRNISVLAQGLSVNSVGVGEFAQVRQQSTQCHQVLQPAGLRCDLAPRTQSSIEVHPARLIDIESQSADFFRWRPVLLSTGEKAPRLRESMRHRGDLRLDQRGAGRLRIDLAELSRQRLQAIKCRYVADELRRQALVINNRLGDPIMPGILKEPTPGPPARAL